MNTAYEEIVMGKMVNHNNHTEEELKALQQKCRSRLKTSIIVAILLFPVAIASIVKSSIAVKKADDGNYADARELQLKYLKLINTLFCEVNPIPVKAAMAEMGFCENSLRSPLTVMEDDHREKMVAIMKELDLI